VIDRFVRGDDVPDDVLRQVWQNAAVTGTVWDVPIYEEFYRTVRAVNGSLPKARHLRVLQTHRPHARVARSDGSAEALLRGRPPEAGVSR
jgi:hypothetical protein